MDYPFSLFAKGHYIFDWDSLSDLTLMECLKCIVGYMCDIDPKEVKEKDVYILLTEECEALNINGYSIVKSLFCNNGPLFRAMLSHLLMLSVRGEDNKIIYEIGEADLVLKKKLELLVREVNLYK